MGKARSVLAFWLRSICVVISFIFGGVLDVTLCISLIDFAYVDEVYDMMHVCNVVHVFRRESVSE